MTWWLLLEPQTIWRQRISQQHQSVQSADDSQHPTDFLLNDLSFKVTQTASHHKVGSRTAGKQL